MITYSSLRMQKVSLRAKHCASGYRAPSEQRCLPATPGPTQRGCCLPPESPSLSLGDEPVLCLRGWGVIREECSFFTCLATQVNRNTGMRPQAKLSCGHRTPHPGRECSQDQSSGHSLPHTSASAQPLTDARRPAAC